MRHIIHQTFDGNVPKKEIRRKLKDRQITFAADVPDFTVLPTIVQAYQSGLSAAISLPFGMAVVHPDDQFVRKEGVRRATEKMEHVTFEIIKIEMGFAKSKKQGVFTIIQLVNERLSVGIELVVNFSSGTTRVMIGQLESNGEEHEQSGCQGNCACGNH